MSPNLFLLHYLTSKNINILENPMLKNTSKLTSKNLNILENTLFCLEEICIPHIDYNTHQNVLLIQNVLHIWYTLINGRG